MLWAHMSTEGKHDVFLKLWYPDGTPKSIKYLNQTIPHGLHVEYHSNGQEKLRGTWNKGVKVGEWVSRDMDGEILKQETFPMGTTEN